MINTNLVIVIFYVNFLTRSTHRLMLQLIFIYKCMSLKRTYRKEISLLTELFSKNQFQYFAYLLVTK